MTKIFIVSVFLLIVSGCGQSQDFLVPMPSGDLPVYGTDPMMHTIYMGSDEEYHHFRYQNGKSGGFAVVAVADTQIKPEPFELDSGKEAFVESANPDEITLIVLQGAR
ncbi:MAG: hypothetical protein AAF589_04065 [Planctomycetota bacterium]